MTADHTNDVSELAVIANDVLLVAGNFRIKNDAEHQAAGALVRQIATKRREAESRLDFFLKPIKESEKRLRDDARPYLEQIKGAEAAVKGEIVRYATEQDAIRRETERKLREAAERERLERERIAEEHRKKAEAATTDGVRARYEALAEAQEEKASSIAPPVLAAPEKVAGVGMRDQWSAAVTDLRALVEAVAAGSVDIEAVLPNQTYLNGLARALKQGMQVPGVRAVNNPTVAARGI